MRLATSSRLLSFLVLSALVSMAYGQGLNNNEVVFTGITQSVNVNGEGVGTLFVRVDTLDLRVIVNPRTRLELAAGEPLTMDQLAQMAGGSEGVIVEVAGKFSSSGILANVVRVLDTLESNTFDLRGHITKIQSYTESTAISLLGITIKATPDTDITMDGAEAQLADLKNGTKIHAAGSIGADGSWLATSIWILTGSQRSVVRFEGEVVSWDSATGLLKVAVNGADGNVTDVWVTSDTRITGELAEGAYVHVVGKPNPDYSITAREVCVIAPFEIKPDEVKIKVGEKASFTIKLREPAAENVEITLAADPDGALTFSPNPVTILAGELTAGFEATAVIPGVAIIRAAGLDAEVTAVVKVGELSDDDEDTPDAEVRIAISPDHIKLEPNESREVVLHVNPPQRTEVPVTFEVVSDVAGLFSVAGQRVLSNGAAYQKLMIRAGAAAGNGSLIVTLPAELGGGKAELLVQVASKGSGKK